MTADKLKTLVEIVVGGFAIIGGWAAFGGFVKNAFSWWGHKRQAAAIKRKKLQGHYDDQVVDNATRHYIWPKCSNSDPAHQAEINALITTQEDLREKVDEFLEKGDSKRHLLILADSGTGKTSFLLNYFAYNLRRPFWKKQHDIALVHLGSADCEERIRAIENPKETVLFLDALDEDTKAVSGHSDRVCCLMTLCAEFSHVVMTCRTQFFPSDEEIPTETGIARIGPRSAGESGIFEFWRMYLSPLSDRDVRIYIRRRFPVWRLRRRRAALAFAEKIPKLCARPMLLAHIPDIVRSQQPVRTVSDLYEVMVQAWVDREDSWTDKTELRHFSERLAVEIFKHRDVRKSEGMPADELPGLAERWGVNLEPWQLTGRSLLNRDAEGNYKFAHRSIMEYLAASRLEWFEPGDLELTDVMRRFVGESFQLPAPGAMRAVVVATHEAAAKMIREWGVWGSALGPELCDPLAPTELPPSGSPGTALSVCEYRMGSHVWISDALAARSGQAAFLYLSVDAHVTHLGTDIDGSAEPSKLGYPCVRLVRKELAPPDLGFMTNCTSSPEASSLIALASTPPWKKISVPQIYRHPDHSPIPPPDATTLPPNPVVGFPLMSVRGIRQGSWLMLRTCDLEESLVIVCHSE